MVKTLGDKEFKAAECRCSFGKAQRGEGEGERETYERRKVCFPDIRCVIWEKVGGKEPVRMRLKTRQETTDEAK